MADMDFVPSEAVKLPVLPKPPPISTASKRALQAGLTNPVMGQVTSCISLCTRSLLDLGRLGVLLPEPACPRRNS